MRLRLAGTVCAFLLMIVSTAYAQTGSVTGVVTDQSGGVLPGVTVTATGERTGAVRTAVTDSVGKYTVANVAPGPYEVTFELSGFAKQTSSSVMVAAGQTFTLDAKLAIGGQAERIEVTGTLIARPALEAASPVTTLGIEDLASRGITRVEDILISTPQVFAAQNSTVSNGSSGTATVDLRHLGAGRTLVLIDGKRMSAGDAFATSPDLNFIPTALIKRVDVLTGGASAVYGADAVAGVVNFILDRDFEGVKGSISGGDYQHNNNNSVAQAMNKAKGFTPPSGSIWGGGNSDVNVALGGKFGDKGHGTIFFDYRKTESLLKAKRDYTNCSVGLGGSGPTCSGSSTIPTGRFITFNSDFSKSANYTLDTTTGNTFRPRTSADVFNYGPFNFMQRPDQKLSAGGFLNYGWNKHAEGYADVMLMDDYTDAQIAPSGDFGNTSLLNCDNPMLSAQERQVLCTNMGYGLHDIANVTILKRNVEGGPRVSQLRHDDFRFVGGVRGDINNAWSYDVYGLDAEVHSPQTYANDLNSIRLQDALIVDGDPNDPSSWHCRSGNAGCVPWNIFKTGGVTQAALDYLSLPLILNSGTTTRMFSGKITGNLKERGVAFPGATEGLKVAFGGGFHKESLFVNPDQAYRDGIGSGQGGPTLPVDGSYNIKEFFTEALVPFLQNAEGRDVSVELGYRLSNYSTSGSFPTYKAMLSLAPDRSLRFRTGFNRATRAANVQELFVPQGLGLGGTTDICAGTAPTATAAQCANTGVKASQYGKVLENPANQYNTISGGNPKLTPEIADTFTVGVVVTPSAAPGFTASIDYYNVKIDKTIGNLAADDIINACANTGNPTLCGLIHRDVAGTLWLTTQAYTVTTNQNIGKLGARGIDTNFSYMRPIGTNTLSVDFLGSITLRSTIDTGLFAYDCRSFFGNQCGDPTPTWRHLARASYQIGSTTATLGWRMVGHVTNDDGSSNTAIGDPSNVALLKKNDIYEIGAQHYLDLTGSYNFRKGVQFVFGVNNILDKEPNMGAGMSGNDLGPGFHGTYDPYGRYVHTALNFLF